MVVRSTIRKTILFSFGFMLSAAIAAGSASAASIVGSKHDFTSTSSGTNMGWAAAFNVPGGGGFPEPIENVCVFCHTPHGGAGSTAAAPLWNRTTLAPATSGYTYQMYTSDSFTYGSAAPTGISALCMSCHDGVTSVAVGTLLNAPGSAAPGDVKFNDGTQKGALGDLYWVMPDGTTFSGWGPNIGNNYPGSGSTTINLSNDHPVSFVYPTKTGINPSSGLPAALRLFGASKNMVECATCHLVHNPQYPPFLAMENIGSQMCLSCHNK